VTKLSRLLVLLPIAVLASCASIETDPNPGPQPEPPVFRRCQTCEGTNCVVVWIGQKTCKAEEDEQGRFCLAQGGCIIGTFGATTVAGPANLPTPDADVLAVQERFNDHFRTAVAERLGACFDDLGGEGTVTIEHEYIRREGGDWVPYDLSVVDTTVPGAERKAIGKCARAAVKGVILPYDPRDGDERELLLIWTWAVPLPSS
jgi:hypothetical protein